MTGLGQDHRDLLPLVSVVVVVVEGAWRWVWWWGGGGGVWCVCGEGGRERRGGVGWVGGVCAWWWWCGRGALRVCLSMRASGMQ